jgi:hypothetical protein
METTVPKLPWRAVHPAHRATQSPHQTVVVMASRFELKRLRDVPRFLLDSVRIRRQVLRADGALGVSLVAHPLRRQFLTLSAWSDRRAVNGLVGTEPHRSAMQRHHLAMAEARFTFWEVDHADLPINWNDARRRLDADHP